jgi:hypothetical protein
MTSMNLATAQAIHDTVVATQKPLHEVLKEKRPKDKTISKPRKRNLHPALLTAIYELSKSGTCDEAKIAKTIYEFVPPTKAKAPKVPKAPKAPKDPNAPKYLHKSQMSRAMLVEKFGEADAKAELDRRNANALKARDELKTKAKEWQSLTDEVARLRGLLDAANVDHTGEAPATAPSPPSVIVEPAKHWDMVVPSPPSVPASVPSPPKYRNMVATPDDEPRYRVLSATPDQ